MEKILEAISKLLEKATTKDVLVYVGAFGLLALGIVAAFSDMKWFVLIPLELILMVLVIMGTRK